MAKKMSPLSLPSLTYQMVMGTWDQHAQKLKSLQVAHTIHLYLTQGYIYYVYCIVNNILFNYFFVGAQDSREPNSEDSMQQQIAS